MMTAKELNELTIDSRKRLFIEAKKELHELIIESAGKGKDII